MTQFASSLEHILAELERIDLLVRGHVARVRRVQTDDEQFRGLYISENEVDALLEKPTGVPQWLWADAGQNDILKQALETLAREIEKRKPNAAGGFELRLDLLQQRFGLSTLDRDIILVCLAVEIDLRYEKLYAYLQDDVTRKKPSVDLLLNLLTLSAEQKRFAMAAPLRRFLLIELIDDPAQPQAPLIAKYVRIDERIVNYLLNDDALDERLHAHVRVAESASPLTALVFDSSLDHGFAGLQEYALSTSRTVVHLTGPDSAAQQVLAAGWCRERGLHLLLVDLAQLLADGAGLSKWLVLIQREARLQSAALYWNGLNTIAVESRGAFDAFLRNLEDSSIDGLNFFAGEALVDDTHRFSRLVDCHVTLARPDFIRRADLWRRALGESAGVEVREGINTLSAKFKFTESQICDATALARKLAVWRATIDTEPSLENLYEACRQQSNQRLATLARKITPTYRWDDIVLPADRIAQLREICNHIKYRDRVYGDWGFGRKLALGKGLAVLFAGPSGTGKTMAADILANELGLDLYKINLASVISKYIGETEKNLAKIFDEAETSNAILFFDEADALFGKRSEVKDSHDRYANIEVGYLLQRMEEYEGMAILATNLRKNMDDAFVRRLHFTLEMPVPDAAHRYQIWQGVWPRDLPRDRDVDLQLLAERFELTGGNIRNVALASAFLAAEEGDVVRMSHVIHATQREYQKTGKLLRERD